MLLLELHAVTQVTRSYALLLHATQRVNKPPLWMKTYYGRISERYTTSKAKLCALMESLF